MFLGFMAIGRPFQTQIESEEMTFTVNSYVERTWNPFYEWVANSEV